MLLTADCLEKENCLLSIHKTILIISKVVYAQFFSLCTRNSEEQLDREIEEAQKKADEEIKG